MSRDGLRSPLAPERVAGPGMVEVGGTAFVGAGMGRIWLGGCVRGGVCPSGLGRLECILGKSVRNPSARALARVVVSTLTLNVNSSLEDGGGGLRELSNGNRNCSYIPSSTSYYS